MFKLFNGIYLRCSGITNRNVFINILTLATIHKISAFPADDDIVSISTINTITAIATHHAVIAVGTVNVITLRIWCNDDIIVIGAINITAFYTYASTVIRR